MVDHMTLRFVHNIVFAAYAVDSKAGAAHHFMDLIAMQPGGVDDIAGFKVPLRGVQEIALLQTVYAGNGGGKPQVTAIHNSGFRQCEGKFPRADNGSGGSIKRGSHLLADIRLHCTNLIGGQQPDTGDAVFQALTIQHIQMTLVLLTEGKNQRTDLLTLYVQLFTQLLCQLDAAHIGFCHQRVGSGIIARMQNGAVRLGGAVGYIIICLQHQYLAVIPAQLVSGSSAYNTAADDGNIVFHKLLHKERQIRILLNTKQIYHYSGGFSIVKKENKT